MQHAKVGVVLVDAHHLVGLEAVGLVQHHVQRQADRQIGLEGGVHRHQRALGGLVQGGIEGDDTVQHRLAVLGFTHLKIRRLRRGFDKVTGRIDREKPHALTRNLPAKDQRHIELHPGLLKRCGISLVDPADGRTQHPGGVKHAARVPDGDRLAALGVGQLLDLQNLSDRLAHAQVTGRQQHHEALARLLINDHLAKSADLVKPGIGARVGQKNQPGFEFDGDAVGHGF